MKRAATCLVALALMAPAGGIHADTLLIDRVQREAAVERPTRGMNMDAVLARFGEPQSRHAPVGGDQPQHPPITRWVYPTFTVYFENSTVIDAVVNRLSALEQGPKPAE